MIIAYDGINGITATDLEFIGNIYNDGIHDGV
jgi:hypothetical protein